MLTIVIPVVDEARMITRCLDALAAQPGIDEILVVDGGSVDGTVALARAHAVRPRVIETRRGRGHQLETGGRAARGDVVLFLHVDVRLPTGAAAIVEQTLADPGVVAGAFRTFTVSDRPEPPRWAPLLHLADLRSRYSGLPYGDQALFVRGDVFHAIGGFPDVPLMEDLVFAKQLRRFGRVRVVRHSVRVSGRRFESAPFKQTFWVNVFPLLYALGVAPAMLARLYGDPR
jgi:rSAM/selenodomain-associated transferase 2